MKLKFTLIHSNRLTGCARSLRGFVSGNRKILLGLTGIAILSMSGCAVDGVGLVAGGGYYPYSGDYDGGYGPYDGGEFIVGGVRHGGHYGGHHFYGSSFGRGGSSRGGHGGGHGGGRRR